MYLIFSDKDFISPMVFTEKPYDSYKVFKDEFISKIGIIFQKILTGTDIWAHSVVHALHKEEKSDS